MNINQIMKQAQAMQKKIADAQAQMELIEVEGSSGGGMVKATLNGKGFAKKIKIDPKLIDPNDIEMLEDLIVAAINDAKNKAEDESNKRMNDAASGIQLPPGFKMPF